MQTALSIDKILKNKVNKPHFRGTGLTVFGVLEITLDPTVSSLPHHTVLLF